MKQTQKQIRRRKVEVQPEPTEPQRDETIIALADLAIKHINEELED